MPCHAMSCPCSFNGFANAPALSTTMRVVTGVLGTSSHVWSEAQMSRLSGLGRSNTVQLTQPTWKPKRPTVPWLRIRPSEWHCKSAPLLMAGVGKYRSNHNPNIQTHFDSFCDHIRCSCLSHHAKKIPKPMDIDHTLVSLRFYICQPV